MIERPWKNEKEKEYMVEEGNGCKSGSEEVGINDQDESVKEPKGSDGASNTETKDGLESSLVRTPKPLKKLQKSKQRKIPLKPPKEMFEAKRKKKSSPTKQDSKKKSQNS